jgi:hypothetical protein
MGVPDAEIGSIDAAIGIPVTGTPATYLVTKNIGVPDGIIQIVNSPIQVSITRQERQATCL